MVGCSGMLAKRFFSIWLVEFPGLFIPSTDLHFWPSVSLQSFLGIREKGKSSSRSNGRSSSSSIRTEAGFHANGSIWKALNSSRILPFFYWSFSTSARLTFPVPSRVFTVPTPLEPIPVTHLPNPSDSPFELITGTITSLCFSFTFIRRQLQVTLLPTYYLFM